MNIYLNRPHLAVMKINTGIILAVMNINRPYLSSSENKHRPHLSSHIYKQTASSSHKHKHRPHLSSHEYKNSPTVMNINTDHILAVMNINRLNFSSHKYKQTTL